MPSARSSTRSAPASSPTSASATSTTSTGSSASSAASRSPAAACCSLGFLPPAWIGGTAALSLSKILDNMEIGHNVMHGQYDWTGDPRLNGKTFEWDTACPGDQWRHSHNYMHHTHTNIVGKDRDIGYGILRMSEDEPWRPYYLGNPLYAALLASVLPVRGRAARPRGRADRRRREHPAGEARASCRRSGARCAARRSRTTCCSRCCPVPSFPFVLAGNATANLTRNLWAFTIIFCGHFPDGTQQFTEEEAENETRGEWYYRQMLGSANLTGGKLFHILAGNLSYQIEHHLFPDLPAHRYAEIAEEVREICERYGIPYNTGPLHRQFGSVVRKIVKLALPPLPGLRGSEPGPREPADAVPPQKPASAKTGTRNPPAPKPRARKAPAAKAGRRTPTAARSAPRKPPLRPERWATPRHGSESQEPSPVRERLSVCDVAGGLPTPPIPRLPLVRDPLRRIRVPRDLARSPRARGGEPTCRRWA